jgi:hypothetical protein
VKRTIGVIRKDYMDGAIDLGTAQTLLARAGVAAADCEAGRLPLASREIRNRQPFAEHGQQWPEEQAE